MKLTNEQYEFFKDLNLSQAIEHGEGLVRFTFPHNDRIVEVQPHSLGEADILVHEAGAGDDSTRIDRALSLFDIPDTSNMSGPTLLKQLHNVVHNRNAYLLKEAWIGTPYVEQWPVDVFGSRVKFSFHDEVVCYELWASKSREIMDTATVELLVDWKLTHTFLIPMRYIMKPTAQFVFELAQAITEAWRDEVKEESK